MNLPETFRHWSQHWTLQLMLLGVATGLLAGAVVLAFRWAIIQATDLFTLGGGFAALPPWGRLLLPAAGGLAVGLLAVFLFKRDADVGVARVLERVAYGSSHLGWQGAVAQFVFGVIAIGTGHSVGREGPSIHMGAVIGSMLGQRAGADAEYLRILVATGAAGAVAGALNIPLAGVVFAIEVILGEYTLMLFAPVVVSSVIGSVVTDIGIGQETLLVMPDLPTPVHPYTMLPLDWVIGLGAALVSIGVIRGLEGINYLTERLPIPDWALPGVGGLLVGLIAMDVPAVMGVSYGTLSHIYAGELAVGSLFVLLAGKLVATVVSLGTHARGGAIGPSLFMGAVAGALLAEVAREVLPWEVGPTSAYAVIGMGAGMAAILNAPFSAIVAVFELVEHSGVILPVMLATVTAAVTSRDWFHAQSVFAWTLHLRELSEPGLPETGVRCTVPVNAVMREAEHTLPVLARPEEVREAQSESGLQVIFPVEDAEGFIGVVDLGGLLRAGMAEADTEGRISLYPYLYPAEELRHLYPGDRVVNGLDLMAAYGLEAYPVMSPQDPDRVIGYITQPDAVRACGDYVHHGQEIEEGVEG
jgi:CIC family chloride channel protein